MQHVTVTEIQRPAIGIKRFELRPAGQGGLLPFRAGDHIEIRTPDEGGTRAYSLCNDPADRDRYVVAVLRESFGRGGSKSMHDKVARGTVLEISDPRSAFPLDERGMHWTLIAGGIGATPLVSMAHRLHAMGAPFDFHYIASSERKLIFREELASVTLPGKLHLHVSEGDPRNRFDPAPWLRESRNGGQVYCCGPEGLMRAVSAAMPHWPEGSLHTETFKPAVPEDAISFEVELARSGAVIPVRKTETILVALWKAGYPRPLSCETGICGTCRTPYLAGEPDHRDEMLSESERRHEMLICVSRCRSKRLVLDI